MTSYPRSHTINNTMAANSKRQHTQTHNTPGGDDGTEANNGEVQRGHVSVLRHARIHIGAGSDGGREQLEIAAASGITEEVLEFQLLCASAAGLR